MDLVMLRANVVVTLLIDVAFFTEISPYPRDQWLLWSFSAPCLEVVAQFFSLLADIVPNGTVFFGLSQNV
jgi:hypothetical protein